MVVTFFGHSQFYKKQEYECNLLAFLEDTVGDASAEFYFGGYGAFDGFAYECCKKYKRTHPRVSLLFITPYMTLEYQKNHLEYCKRNYDGIIYPEIEDKPLKFAISYRNRWMVEMADCVVVYINHNWGGAYKTYRYAKSKRKKIFNLAELK